MEEYYIKREDKYGNISFEKIDINKRTICGYKIEEVMTILQGLDVERKTEIKMTMKNLQQYMDLIRKEQETLMQNSINQLLNKK